MKIGFTGTREGMTMDQWRTVEDLMLTAWYRARTGEFHDGDCLGADTQAHGSAAKIKRDGMRGLELHGHPCNLHKWRAHNEYDFTHPVKPPLVRNRLIVMAVDLMIAAPKEYDEVIRGSGTWATIRFAQLKRRHLHIVWPDGSSREMFSGT